MNTVLITGGAGFVGSNLGTLWKRDFPDDRVIAFDNLIRKGSELALPRLQAAGVDFVRGDVRNPGDLDSVGAANLVLDCSAEPSVQAGYPSTGSGRDGESPRYLLDTNLGGTLNCLEFARTRGARLVFLSTSRVYPIAALRNLPLEEGSDRLVLASGKSGRGWSANGISTEFPLNGPRSLYGASKLASELIVQEYAATYGMDALINRCGVVAGPWQMGKVDQGFFALWAAQFLYGGSLAYTGFGGTGKQVRDLLHVSDLYDLIRIQLADAARHSGKTYNVGGGADNSVSLRELSGLCASLSGNTLAIGSNPDTHPSDIPWYVTDNSEVTAATGWSPKRSVPGILENVFQWLREHRDPLEPVLRR